MKVCQSGNRKIWSLVLCFVVVFSTESLQLWSPLQRPTASRIATRVYSTAEKTTVKLSNDSSTIDLVDENEPLVAGLDASRAEPIQVADNVDVAGMEQSLNIPSSSVEDNNEKFVILALIWCIAFLSALDRVAMSVALVPMTEEFGFSDSLKGSISAFFSVGYGLSILPAGLLLASFSTRTIMACGIALWSAATLATPFTTDLLAASMVPLLLVRAFVGVGESIVVPSIQRLLSLWTSAEEKGLALSFIFSGFHAGTIGAYLLSPFVMDELFGWRGLFYVYGSVGMLVLVPWLVFAKDAPTPIKASPSTLQKRSFDEAIDTFKSAPWKDFLHSKGAWGMLLAHAAKNWGLYNTLAWSPTFYSEQYGIGVRESAWLSVAPSVAGVVGGFFAGFVADKALSSMDDTLETRTRIRKTFQSIAMFGSGASLAVLAYDIPDEAWLAQVFLMLSLGFMSFNAAGYEAGNQEKAGPKWSGLLYSVTSLPAVIAGTVGVYATGRVLDLTNQDWSLVFSLNAGINVLGALAFLALFDSKREFD